MALVALESSRFIRLLPLVERPKQLQQHKADDDYGDGRSGIDGQRHRQTAQAS